jgi:hypothetical protein
VAYLSRNGNLIYLIVTPVRLCSLEDFLCIYLNKIYDD